MKVRGSCKRLHESSVLLHNLIDRWFHFYFFELFGREPDKTDETLFFLDMGFLCSEILDEIEVDIFIDGRVPSFVTSSKRKRDSFDKFLDTEHRCFEPCLFCDFTKSSISWCLIIFCVSFGECVDDFSS